MSFYLNKTVCFDQNNVIWKIKDKSDDATSDLIFIFFFFFSLESYSGGHIFRSFHASSFNQTKKSKYQNDGLTFYRTPLWFFLAN